MRYSLTFLCILSFGFTQAQYMRADQLPSVYGEIHHVAYTRASIDAKENLYYHNAMVDIQNKKLYTEARYFNNGQQYTDYRLFYSPDRRYKVYSYVDAPNYPATKGSRKPPRADWLTYVMAVAWDDRKKDGSSEYFMTREYYEENFSLAITSEGKLITTDPGKIGKQIGNHEPDIKHINGLYLVDPRDGSKKTITTDKIDTRNVFSRWTFLTKDESCVVLVLSRKISLGVTQGEVISYNINTGVKTGFTRERSLIPVMVGNNILMSSDYVGKPESPYEMLIIRINDGKVLAEVGMQGQQDQFRFDLRSDTLFYFGAANYTLATFVPGKDEMELRSLLPVDTVNLGFAPIPYNLTVLNNSFALIPAELPKGHWEKRQYSGYMMLFDRKNAAPQFAVKPFFHDPKTAAANLAAENRKYREECEELKRKTPYTYGTILRPKEGSDKQPVIFMGPDCGQDKYLIRTAGGTGFSFGLYLYQLADRYTALGPEYYVCSACSGAGKITESFTSADDKWEQINFNVYVRNKNATKTETITSKCKKCLGEGVLKSGR